MFYNTGLDSIVNAGLFEVGITYTINTVGTTDFGIPWFTVFMYNRKKGIKNFFKPAL